MTDTQDHQQKYSAGERIILGIEFYDDNGIYDVRGLLFTQRIPSVTSRYQATVKGSRVLKSLYRTSSPQIR